MIKELDQVVLTVAARQHHIQYHCIHVIVHRAVKTFLAGRGGEHLVPLVGQSAPQTLQQLFLVLDN